MQKFDYLLETDKNMTGFVPNCKIILQVIWTILFYITVHEDISQFPFLFDPTPTHNWRLSVVRRAQTASYLLNNMQEKTLC